MAYIEIKTINGRKYKYLRRSIRVNGKMKKISLKCIGPVNPIYQIQRSVLNNSNFKSVKEGMGVITDFISKEL